MPDPVEELVNECHRQSETCAYTAVTFTARLRDLRRIRTFCVIAPVVFGVLATWKVVEQGAPIWGAVWTLLATVIPPAYRASKVDKAIEEYAALAGEFTNLRDRFRHAALVSSHKPLSEFESEVKPYLNRLEKARQVTLTPPERYFRYAQRKIQSGHYKHDYDLGVTGLDQNSR